MIYTSLTMYIIGIFVPTSNSMWDEVYLGGRQMPLVDPRATLSAATM